MDSPAFLTSTGQPASRRYVTAGSSPAARGIHHNIGSREGSREREQGRRDEKGSRQVGGKVDILINDKKESWQSRE